MLLTSGNHVLMFQAVFVGSLSGWVVIHPDFTIVAPEHGVGLPKLQFHLRVGPYAPRANSTHMGLPQSWLLR